MPGAGDVSIRALVGKRDEMAELQRVIEGAPGYAHLITGVPPGPADAQSTFSILPEGVSYEDKFVFGIYRASDMVGCADLIRSFPTPGVAHLGLLLISEAFQGQGIGRSAYRQIENVVRSWHEFSMMRIGVVRANAQVLPFWSRLGFAPTGEVKPYRAGNVVSEVIVLTKPLAWVAE